VFSSYYLDLLRGREAKAFASNLWCKLTFVSAMAAEALPEEVFVEAVEDKHYSKVSHPSKKGTYVWKFLLHGCPCSEPWSLKDYINAHWSRDDATNLQITVAEPAGPKRLPTSKHAEAEELMKLCDRDSGNFPRRWMKYKKQKLESKRAEVC
jgi:hypothetical protein